MFDVHASISRINGYDIFLKENEAFVQKYKISTKVKLILSYILNESKNGFHRMLLNLERKEGAYYV